MSDFQAPLQEASSFARPGGPTRRVALRIRTPSRSRDISVEESEHRARNLIQLAAGLLRAQALRTDTRSARLALESASDRLIALAQAYARLDEPDGEGQVDLGRQLRSLCRAWDGHGDGFQVALSVDAQPLTLPAQRARAVLLLANEAITNALKHAYPQMTGVVAVRLHRCAAGRLWLSIEDQGAGLDGQAADGFGFLLMRTLAGQLGGVLTCKAADGGGTAIAVEFPESESQAGSARQA